ELGYRTTSFRRRVTQAANADRGSRSRRACLTSAAPLPEDAADEQGRYIAARPQRGAGADRSGASRLRYPHAGAALIQGGRSADGLGRASRPDRPGRPDGGGGRGKREVPVSRERGGDAPPARPRRPVGAGNLPRSATA